MTQITTDKDKYQVCLDVKQFSPEEITVKTVGRQVIVEGKHEKKDTDNGFISRRFVRKYLLPEQYKVEEVSSNLSSDGVLSILAPREKSESIKSERTVQITHIGSENMTVETTPQTKSVTMDR